MRAHRIMPWIGGAAVGIVISATIGTAFAGYSTGETFSKASPSYQLGYVAGAMDMLAGLQGAKLLKDGPMNDDAAKLVQCLSDRKIRQSQVRGAYLSYLKVYPAKAGDSAAIDVFNAAQMACSKK
jgi:hypothetical protein